MKKLIIFVLCSVPFLVFAQNSTLEEHYVKALDAHQKQDYVEFYNEIMKARSLAPHHQGVLYQAGIAAALNKKTAEAIQYLKQAILIQADFILMVPDLGILRGIPAFERLKQLKEQLMKPLIVSDTAFVVKDRSLHLEGIAAHEKSNIFYLGSIHHRKIIKVDANGNHTDFTKEGQDGLGAVFGLKVDAKNQVLWASSSPAPQMKNYSEGPSAVFKYDITSGKLLKKFFPENPQLDLVLGDLVLTKKGEVYASDSKNNLVFKVNEDNGKLEQFFSSDEFTNIQGITCSDDGKILFIADYVKGIYRLELSTRRLERLQHDLDVSTKAIDGLTYFENTLIGIQNFVTPMRVTRFSLDNAMNTLIDFNILENAHPAYNEPTMGCVLNGDFYYIANSQWNGYDEQQKPKPFEMLEDIVILRIDLQ